MKAPITFTAAFQKKYFREKYVLNHIETYNGQHPVDWDDFTKVFLIELVDYFKETVSHNSARLYCACLKSLLNKYSEEIEIPCKDYASILSLKKAGTINTYLTPDEIQLLINYTPENDLEHTVRNQFVVSCLTGMRHSDAVHLDENSITNSEIIYVARKTNTTVKTISCPVTEYLIGQQQKTRCPDRTFNYLIKPICKKAGIDSKVKVVRAGVTETDQKWKFVSSHTARRSFATNLYLKTLDILLVSKLMGHSDIKITQGYLCCSFEKNEQVLNYVNQFSIGA